MRKYERGQGLTEYALVLVLVAIAVISVITLLGPIIQGIFCEIVYVLGPGDLGLTWPNHTEYLDINQYSATFKVAHNYEEDPNNQYQNICYHVFHVEDVGNPSHGDVEHIEYTTFAYTQNEMGAGTDDSFTFSWHYGFPNDIHTGLVTIIVGEPDQPISQSSLMSSSETTTKEKIPKTQLNEVQETIFELMEAIEEQEERFQEGVDLAAEASGEGLEVLIEFAVDSGDLLLSESLSQLLAEVKAGNLDSVQDTIIQIGADLAQTPIEVWLDMSLKMAPSLTKSCVVVSEAKVSPDAVNAAFEAIEGLDDGHPGKVDALELLQDGVATIEARNTAAAEYVDFQSAVLQTFVEGFEYVGEYEIAAQLAADSEACGN